MKPVTELLRGWVHPATCPDVTIGGLSLDSRALSPGDAFVALPGAHAHGMDFIDQARAAGAAVILCSDSDVSAGDLVAVPDLAAKLPQLARRMWDDPAAALRLHGVTGTNGKSSCAWLLAQAVDGAMIGTLGAGRPGALQTTAHTTPDILRLYRTLAELRDAGFTQVAMEVSSHALAQNRIAGLAFESVTFTNLSHDHLDYHDSREAYGETKARLFTDWPSEIQLVNIDDPFGAALGARLTGRPGLIRYGLSAPAEIRATAGRATLHGVEFRLQHGGGAVAVHSMLLGEFNIHNLLAVAGVLLHQGMALEELGDCLAALTPVPGRMHRLPGDQHGPDVVVDYAHSPDALERVLRALVPLTPGALTCVFGCGGDRDRAKRPKMGAIAERLADCVVLTDDNPRGEDGLAIIRDIQSGMTQPARARVIRDRAEAIATAVREAAPGDLVVVAGKGHEAEQIVGDERLPFSDFDAVRRALERAA